MYHYNLGGYLYILDTGYPMNDGKFKLINFCLIIPHKIFHIRSKNWFRTQGTRNKLLKERQKVYLICGFPTERKAEEIPADSLFHRLCLDLESRFEFNSI
ncbi:hypothetical protein Glove_33g50 [Diversispora epigaea]|uniref:Uncharacterized protein n=1 Tax=Diversispora epigaea TaxID=1348612 RepID=A0A397JH08_9GLOM|nr:hypothetical protein Glove_33g50 [Diversispora epigaea]